MAPDTYSSCLVFFLERRAHAPLVPNIEEASACDRVKENTRRCSVHPVSPLNLVTHETPFQY